jgi:hypothetical protein
VFRGRGRGTHGRHRARGAGMRIPRSWPFPRSCRVVGSGGRGQSWPEAHRLALPRSLAFWAFVKRVSPPGVAWDGTTGPLVGRVNPSRSSRHPRSRCAPSLTLPRSPMPSRGPDMATRQGDPTGRSTAPPPRSSIEHRRPVAVLHQCSVAAQVTGMSRHATTRRLVADLRERH